MELLLLQSEKYCYTCENVFSKKFMFKKGIKPCRYCQLNFKKYISINVKCNCIVCLWTGYKKDFKNHNCIIENKYKNKIKYIDYRKKEKSINPFFLKF